MTQGVLKRIIPAVASTNAVIAAACALEALKLATNIAKPIDNYLNFTDINGVYCGVVHLEKDPDCPTCSGGYVQMQCKEDDTLQDLIDKLVLKFHLKNPSIETGKEKLYMISELIPELKERSVLNLLRPLKELLSPGEDLLVADEVLSKYISAAFLANHLTKCRPEPRPDRKLLERPTRAVIEKQLEPSNDGSPRQLKQLPIRPPIMPPLPEQLSESEKGSVICPVPRCGGRFTNHDSLSYHCMIEHSELGAAGTPQDFAIRQYRFETKEEYKEWLYERCEETCTSFSTKTSMWSGYAMYRCNRAGTFKTSGTIRSGCTSKKTQSHCSAFLRTSEYTDGSVDVTCCFGHIFHELDPTALRLNERQCGVLRKAIEEQKCLTEISAQMRAEYPPTNRLHYTTSNDIRNLALRIGLPVHLKMKKPGNTAPEGNAEEVEDQENVEDDVVSEDALSESNSSEHTDSDIDEDELMMEPEEQEEEQEQDQQGQEEHETPFFGGQTEEGKRSSSPSPAPVSYSGEDSDSRPMRLRRTPRRFTNE
ncbi:unnamed protein product [Haemonchus placei]|uniref:C2H2-type domain-containing protein n=1 Tax=Haemonchus placei TaxID=6290 RepID=A0A3P7UXF8_HAEPC|nr:unnamed protein product [Haemonchus placei]